MTSLATLVDTAVMGASWLRLERPRLRRATRSRTGRHLALFAWALPPSSNVGVHRTLSFIQYGCRRGWHIDAFSSEPPATQRQHGDELLARVPRETTIHVVPASSREPSYRAFPRIDGGFTNALAYAHSAIKTMANDPPDAVLASGPRFFAFVSALLVARRFGVPLVLDYRDEWTECPFEFVQKSGRDRAWERRCLRNADAVLFTTQLQLQHQLSTFPELDPQKAHVVSNGWDPDEFLPRREERVASAGDTDSMLRIAYLGSLAGQTPPHDFLESLQQLLTNEPEWASRVRVKFIGRRGPRAEEALRAFAFPAVLEVMDQVGKREAIEQMQEGDALLVLAPPGIERYLPAKLFEYLAARRPVLVFGSRGEPSSLVEELGAGVYCPSGSVAALRGAFVQLKQFDIRKNESTIQEWLLAHRREVLADRAFEIIESVAPTLT
jgi:glycosyltransferase involved in cell wall biosynthesis